MGTIAVKCNKFGLPISRLMVMRFNALLSRPFYFLTKLNYSFLPFTIVLCCKFAPHIQKMLSS